MDIQKFKQWAADNKELAKTVVMAQAFTQVEVERVDAYIKPIFERFEFFEEETGERITDEDHLYLADLQSDTIKEYYAACDKAHREHGFDGPMGHCPALVAADLQRQAERLLLDSFEEFFGLEGVASCSLEAWDKTLDLALTGCLGTIVG